jgi:hypothetical protein
MKATGLALALALTCLASARAELFSSSTNFIQTLTVASNEAIFISSVASSPAQGIN